MSKLLGYDFEIVYRAGKQNSAADALSRVSSVELFSLSTVELGIIQQIKEANQSHPELIAWREKWLADPLSLPDFAIKDNMLIFRNRIVLPSDSPFGNNCYMSIILP